MSQNFAVGLKYYKATQINKNEKKDYTVDDMAEGAYVFMPKPQGSTQFSNIDEDIIYEKGSIVEQWTIKFTDNKSKQYAFMKIRNSPYLNEFVEFEVELNPTNVEDSQGKDVTVNWKMLDGFDANKTFWTDANGLEMQKRTIKYEPTEDGKADP